MKYILVGDLMRYLAHTKDGKIFVPEEEHEYQSLKDHLTSVSQYAQGFAEAFGAGEAGALIGRLHDFGKYSELFQKRIRGAKIKYPHSLEGAKILSGKSDWIVNLYGLVIASHHTGLTNLGNVASAGDGSYYDKLLNYQSFPHPAEAILPQDEGVAHKKLKPILGNLQASFSIAVYLKMLFSALVDADYTDTEEYISGRKREPIAYNIADLTGILEKICPLMMAGQSIILEAIFCKAACSMPKSHKVCSP
ncbi:MAG: CRISPR-associated endonuclease Cas3'' [Bacillota bacterium]|jgi:CRISPR-associated endonuclease/helicase Cas3